MYRAKILPQQLRLFAIRSAFVFVLSLGLISAKSEIGVASPTNDIELISPANPTLIWPGYDSQISINPSTPRPGDVIRITVWGEWPNGCVPRYQSHQIEGNAIRINTVPPCFFCSCLMVISPWSFTVEVGSLPVGLYTVEVVGSVYKTTLFMVAKERLYFPIILGSR
jgi:hypothetical protein